MYILVAINNLIVHINLMFKNKKRGKKMKKDKMIYSENKRLFPDISFPNNNLSCFTYSDSSVKLSDKVKDDNGKVLIGKWFVKIDDICPSLNVPKQLEKSFVNSEWVSKKELTNPTYQELQEIHHRYLQQSGDWHYGLVVSNVDYANRVISFGAES